MGIDVFPFYWRIFVEIAPGSKTVSKIHIENKLVE
jgi:hypothetical protein